MPKAKKVKTKTDRRAKNDPVQFSEFTLLVKAVAELRADVTKLVAGLRTGGPTPSEDFPAELTEVMRRVDPEQVVNFKRLYRGLYDDYQRNTLVAALTRFFLAWDDYQASKQMFLFALHLRENEVEFVESNKVEWSLARVLMTYFPLGSSYVFRQYTHDNNHHLLVNRSDHEMCYGADFDDDAPDVSDEELKLGV